MKTVPDRATGTPALRAAWTAPHGALVSEPRQMSILSLMSATLREQTQSYEVKRVRADLDLSREKLARVFDVSAKTIERWEARGSLPKDAAGRRLLAELREIVDLATLVFGAEGMRRFLALPLPEYDGATPLQLIERRQSSTVLAALVADYEGVGP